MATEKYLSHKVVLLALFTLGNLILSVQKINLINVCLSVAIIFLVSGLLFAAQKSKAIYFAATLLIFLSAIYGATTTVIDYIRFLKQEQLPQASIYALGLIFLLVTIVFSVSKIEAIYKYCLLTFVFITVIITICFISGIKSFEFENIKQNFFDFSFSWDSFFRFCLPLSVLPFITPQKTKPTFFGLVIAGFLLLMTVVQSGLTFGFDTNIVHPYFKSVGVLSSGSLLSRLDGLAWFLIFVTCLVKASICIKTIIKIIKGGKYHPF